MKAGERLGHYEILSSLGSGGMGEVFRARDVRLGREVAVKALSPALVRAPEALHRLEQEARALAALNHPHVAVLHGLEESGGERFLVMELVRGEPLDRRLERGPLPVDEAANVASEIAGALDAAHQQGIVHRDLKPSNVMISARGGVKLLDFGVSKLLHGAPDAPTIAATAQGAVVGTVPYMSPEQVSGEPVDQRTDIWSFGCVLYEMLAGAPPFARDSAATTAGAILTQQPDWERLPRDVPATVRDLLRRCLQKRADDRLVSLSAVSAALRPEGVAPDTRRRSGRLALAAIGALALAVLGIAWYGFREPAGGDRPQVTSIAVLPLANDSPGGADDYFVDGMTDALINDLAALNLWKVISRTSVMQYRGRTGSLPRIAGELGVDAVVEGSVLKDGDRVRIAARLIHATTEQSLWTGTYERELKDVLNLQRDVARAIAMDLSGRIAPDIDRRLRPAEEVDPQTYLLYSKGRFLWNQRTAASLREAIQHFERVLERSPNYAPAHAGLAESYVLLAGPGLGDRPPSEAFARGVAAARRAIQLDDSLAGAHAALGYSALLWDWDWTVAEREFQTAIRLNPNYANGHFWYAAGLASRGRIDEAIAEARRAVELDPVSPIVAAGLAWMYNFARDYDRAIAVIRPVLELNPRFPTLQSRLAVAYRHKELHELAIDHHRLAVDASGGSADMLAELAISLAAAGRTGEARRVLAQVSAMAERHYVSSYARATVHLALGERRTALDWLEKAADERAWYLPFIAVEPDVDRLRNEPRFEALLDRLHLPRR